MPFISYQSIKGLCDIFINAALIGLSLSVDAFAVSVASCLAPGGIRLKEALKLSLYFGFFQFFMPLAGAFLAGTVRVYVERFGHYISFALLAFIGARMIIGALNGKEEKTGGSLRHIQLLAMAVATSIDAFAVGIGFAFTEFPLLLSCVIIGVVTFAVCLLGAIGAKRIPGRSGKISEIAGGTVLLCIGLKLLIEGILK